MEVGERVIVAGQRKGTVRFAGNTQFAPGIKPSSYTGQSVACGGLLLRAIDVHEIKFEEKLCFKDFVNVQKIM